MAAEYSTLKALHHPEKLECLQNGGQPVPAQVQLVLSDLCNQNCSFCAYRMDGYTSNENFGEKRPDGTVNNNPNRMIPWEKAREIIEDCAALGVQAIQFTGGGEPSLHPNLAEAMRLANGLDMKTALVSNGVWGKASGEVIEAASRATWVRISIDAGRPETYALVRRTNVSSFDKAWETVSRLAGRGPTVGVSFIVTPENYKEIPSFLHRAAASGADNARVAAMFSQDESAPYDDIFDEVAGLIATARKSVERKGFAVHDMFGGRVEDLKNGSPDYIPCGYQHFNAYIGGDMNVYRCCNTAYNPRGLVGSLRSQSFYDFWLSDAKRSAYGDFDARGCTRCAFNSINKVLGEVIQGGGDHAAFV